MSRQASYSHLCVRDKSCQSAVTVFKTFRTCWADSGVFCYCWLQCNHVQSLTNLPTALTMLEILGTSAPIVVLMIQFHQTGRRNSTQNRAEYGKGRKSFILNNISQFLITLSCLDKQKLSSLCWSRYWQLQKRILESFLDFEKACI